ncbi:MAG: cyclase family protein [Candidatus Hodarchaeota archaeon]
MVHFIDLSHNLENNMPGYKFKDKNGAIKHYTAKIRPFLTHKETEPKFQGKCSFEITEIYLQTSVGTYIDSPYHRYPDGRDISEITLDEVILLGIVIDVRDRKEFESVGIEVIPKNLNLVRKAVLFNFEWDRFWGTEKYYSYPFISKELIEFLIQSKVKLVGVDTINIDDSSDLTRPAHSLFLKNDILIVENLANLNQLYDKNFRFFAIPVKGKKVAAMPIRAFAEIL